ncbi:MAG: isoleucine--tRNA ligase [Patescibacteria group bacterium]
MKGVKQKAPAPQSIFPDLEKQVLAFWDKEDIFQKTLDQTRGGEPFVFFEGPPTANGKPGIHHVLARAYKDVIVRYKTMRGFYVERKAGWDTHGLPVEIQVEKELGISGKPEIEKFGIEEFNKKCRDSVWKYKTDLENLTKRIGFWLDMEHPYVTYENDYIESLWWVIKQIWDKGLLYKGHKVVPHCPRCGTALSSHEVAQGYKSVEDNSVYVLFKVKGQEDTYIVSWTTTPWTLPGNVALAVGKDIAYKKVEIHDKQYIVAEAVAEKLFPDAKAVEAMKGEQLIGLEYEPLFDIKPLQKETAYKVYAADFVNTEEGTGVVHTAVMYGEDDYQLGEKVGLPKHHTVDLNGLFTADVSKWAGQFVKQKKVEQGIITDLHERGLLLKEEMHRHDYPFCWRCGTPLLYYAKDSWFIAVTKVKEQLVKNNEDINWVPEFIKHGRFGEWLNEVKDWAFSRERYWGTPLPIWECEKCEKRECLGSIEELVARSTSPLATGNKLDLHRPYIDSVTLTCSCGETMRRVKEVVDVWFDSGCMPYAQWHYPFENKERIDNGKSFPADFIAEGIDQTRGWFYTLLAVSTLLGKGVPYKNVVCLNLVFDAKGQKMSKSKGNIVDPFYIIDKFGADTLRWFLFTVNQPGDAKLFDEKQLEEVVKKQWLIVWNILSFWKMYAGTDRKNFPVEVRRSAHVLDKWIIAKLHETVSQATVSMDAYGVTETGRLIADLITQLSTWYVRRSRNRFKNEGADKQDALAVLRYALATISRLLAPLAPLMAEALYREVRIDAEPISVHMAGWPEGQVTKEGTAILEQMAMVRQAVELGHSVRKDKQIKVRQPLPQFIIKGRALDPEIKTLIQEEVNVKEVIFVETMPQGSEFAFKESGSVSVALDTTITDELKYEGMIREIVRQINAMRKDASLTIGDTITLYYEILDPELEKIFLHYKSDVCRDVIATQCLPDLPDNVDLKSVFAIAGVKVTFGIKKK